MITGTEMIWPELIKVAWEGRNIPLCIGFSLIFLVDCVLF